MGVFVLAFAWEPLSESRAPGRGWRIPLASVLFFLSVWFHPAAAFLTGLVFLLLEWRNVLGWRREWPRMLAVTGPGAVFVVGTYLTAHSSQPLAIEGQTFFSDPPSVLGAAFEYNIGFTPRAGPAHRRTIKLLLPCTYRAVRAHPPLGSGPEAAIGRVVVVLLAAYFVAPGTWAGWAYAAARFSSSTDSCFSPGPQPRSGPRSHVVSSSWGRRWPARQMAIQWPFMQRASARTQNVIDVGASIPSGAKLIPADFNASVLGPQTNGDSWAHLVVSRDVVASQLFAAGRPRMGGERFRMVSFKQGVLDVESGALPWSDFEMWNDIGRNCAPHDAPQNWFVHWDGDCSRHLEDRKKKLEKVIDRYDYLLMLDPPLFIERALLPPKLRLVSHVGSAWLYVIPHAQ